MHIKTNSPYYCFSVWVWCGCGDTESMGSKYFHRLPLDHIKLNKPKLTNEGKLTERAQMVYTEVFYRFGVSQPGTMSPEELNMLQVHCHPNEPLSADDLRHFFSKYHTEAGRLTLQGFLSLYYHDAYNHPKHSWEELQRLGYDSELAITEATAYKWCAPTRWSRARDEQLIELVNYLSEKTGKLALDLTPDDICITTDVGTLYFQYNLWNKVLMELTHYFLLERQHYDQLQLIPPVALKLRFCCMKQFNILVSKALPFIDLTQHEVEGSLAQRLCALRHLIFYVIKAQFLDSILARTASSRVSPSISVSRMKSVLRSSREFISKYVLSRKIRFCWWCEAKTLLSFFSPLLLKFRPRAISIGWASITRKYSFHAGLQATG